MLDRLNTFSPLEIILFMQKPEVKKILLNLPPRSKSLNIKCWKCTILSHFCTVLYLLLHCCERCEYNKVRLTAPLGANKSER